MRSALLTILLAVACEASAQQASAPVLRVGMDTRSPPWAFVPGLDNSDADFSKDPTLTPDQVERLVGIDVDVARAVGRRLGRPLEIVPVAYFQLDQALLDERIDLIVNAWTPTRETPSAIVSSDPYYTWGLLLAVRADDNRILSPADLRGATVGYFYSNLVVRTLHALGAGELRVFDVEEGLFRALRAGEIDAVIYDSPAVRWRVAHDPAFRVAGEPLNKLGYNVAVRREDHELFGKVQAAVRDIVASGESQRIQQRWEQATPNE